MIVDDYEPFREVMKDLLASVGVDNIIEARDFDEAVQLYREKRPHIVFMDMVLPGKSGVDATRAIVEIDKDAIVIAMSSIINKKLIREALGAGAKDFLFKPTNETALNTVIQMWGGD